jgi:hypothetical protein
MRQAWNLELFQERDLNRRTSHTSTWAVTAVACAAYDVSCRMRKLFGDSIDGRQDASLLLTWDKFREKRGEEDCDGAIVFGEDVRSQGRSTWPTVRRMARASFPRAHHPQLHLHPSLARQGTTSPSSHIITHSHDTHYFFHPPNPPQQAPSTSSQPPVSPSPLPSAQPQRASILVQDPPR